jgi:hypothetical protein
MSRYPDAVILVGSTSAAHLKAAATVAQGGHESQTRLERFAALVQADRSRL